MVKGASAIRLFGTDVLAFYFIHSSSTSLFAHSFNGFNRLQDYMRNTKGRECIESFCTYTHTHASSFPVLYRRCMVRCYPRKNDALRDVGNHIDSWVCRTQQADAHWPSSQHRCSMKTGNEATEAIFFFSFTSTLSALYSDRLCFFFIHFLFHPLLLLLLSFSFFHRNLHWFFTSSISLMWSWLRRAK